MAISYRMPIWPHWLWNTGLRCAPQTVILLGFVVCVGSIRLPRLETGKRPRFASLTSALPDKITFIEADGKARASCRLIYGQGGLYLESSSRRRRQSRGSPGALLETTGGRGENCLVQHN